MKEDAKKWMEKAERDLMSAHVNMEQGIFDVASFLAHQAAEKALKNLYILKFNRLWKIHDLNELGKSVDAPKTILIACDALNPHYIQTRYPTDADYTKDMADDAIRNSEKVITWAKKSLKK
jgi:HEPN domain-containing protein